MAELAKKLHFLKNGTEQTAKAYSTTGEVGDNYVPLKIDGVACYAPLGATTDAMATIGRVKKNGTDYAFKESAKPPYMKVEYLIPGTYTFTVPQGITTIRCEIAGAGGGGGSGGGRDGGGGGGSGYKVFGKLIVVEPNSTITVVVGAGGAGGAKSISARGHNGSDGEHSSVASIVAAGGSYGGGGNLDGGGTIGVGGSGGNNGTDSDGYTAGAGGTGGKIGADDGAGGAGGAGGSGGPTANRTDSSSGSDGWVVIEYGGDI